MSSQAEQRATHFFPTLPADAKAFEAPVHEVTVLEDRAQVTRRGKLHLATGRQRLLVWEISPVLQDVSLRASLEAGEASVVDARVRRAFRIRKQEKPQELRDLDAEIRDFEQQFRQLAEKRERGEERYLRTFEMIHKGLQELPQDAGWGHVQPQAWRDTFESLFRRARKLLQASVDDYLSQKDLLEQRDAISHKRAALTQWEQRFIACIELDVEVQKAGDIGIDIHYVVPNALWRPLHSAQLLDDGSLTLTSQASVWQRTGEDWSDAKLAFSTARSSLGTQAPLLSEDLLQAQRKSDELRVEQREVAIQTTGPGGSSDGPPPPRGLELPGVDDGGDLQHLRAPSPTTVASDGRPHIVPLFSFQTEAQTRLVAMPELDPKAFLQSIQRNRSPFPLLAGPVELLRNHGFVGWTQLMFVAPEEAFSLSFGPDDGIRITRTTKREREEDPITFNHRTETRTRLFLSNLEGRQKSLELTERIPVSEVEFVTVRLDEACSPMPKFDAKNGFCTWEVTLEAHQTQKLLLQWELQTPPEVQGL